MILGKNSADDVLKYVSYFPRKWALTFFCKLFSKETVCMKCQSLFYEENNLSSAESAQRAVKVNYALSGD